MERTISIFQQSNFFNPFLLCGLGFLLSISYLILPGYIYLFILLCGAIVLIGILKPEFSYYLVIFMVMLEQVHLFVNITDYWAFNFFPYQIILLTTMMGWVLNRIIDNVNKRQATSIDGIIFIIIGYELISLIWVPVFFGGFLYSISLILGFLLFYITTAIISNEDILRKTVRVWILAGVIVALGVIVNQWVDVYNILPLSKTYGIKYGFSQVKGRASGFAGVDHSAGFIITTIFMALSSMIIEKKGKIKTMYALILLCLVYALIVAGTRGALFGLIGGYIFYFFVHPSFKGRFIKYNILGIFLIIAAILVFRPGYIDRILISFGYTGHLPFSGRTFYGHEGISQGEGLSGFDIRFARWKLGFEEFAENPLKLLFGLGISGFLYYCEGLGGPEVVNVYLAFLFEMGIAGVIILIFLIYLLISNIHYCLKNAKMSYSFHILIAATAILISDVGIHGLVDYDLNSIGAKHVWLPLGFAMAAVNIVKAEIQKNTDKDA